MTRRATSSGSGGLGLRDVGVSVCRNAGFASIRFYILGFQTSGGLTVKGVRVAYLKARGRMWVSYLSAPLIP